MARMARMARIWTKDIAGEGNLLLVFCDLWVNFEFRHGVTWPVLYNNSRFMEEGLSKASFRILKSNHLLK